MVHSKRRGPYLYPIMCFLTRSSIVTDEYHRILFWYTNSIIVIIFFLLTGMCYTAFIYKCFVLINKKLPMFSLVQESENHFQFEPIRGKLKFSTKKAFIQRSFWTLVYGDRETIFCTNSEKTRSRNLSKRSLKNDTFLVCLANVIIYF